MIRLHGFAASNYFNMAKLALLEKGVEFEVVNVHGSQDPDFLAKSPRGKVPVLETAQGFLNETNVILEYIEETQGGKALLPSDPYERGVVRALTKEIELYIELPARSCFMEVFFGGKVDQAIKDKARVELLAGVATLARHGRFAPYVAGNEMTVADIFLLYSFDLASTVAQKLFDIDLKAELPQAAALLELLAQNPNVQKVAADREAEMAAFMAAIRAARK
ncbi:glutathione S-transferase family protein [Pseudomonas abyssi]|uniref:Glutathione S-transferase n=1 Tax=Pseudomonas abyssi TaxID=170540 RepID=A0A395R1Q2_9PSED|nr:glutathione S-transferase [Halopseudomonas gallaeciensis]MAG68237.1 glutathione S-transferase [Pseudomonadales bacterium]RGP54023.1 glutathione S-transferase [Halopseudomonas gallaeciensis]